jgi:hypothetical protein
MVERRPDLTVLPVTDDLRQVLHEVAATGNVHHLRLRHTAHGMPRASALEQRELSAVTLRAKARGLRMRFGAVARAIRATEGQPSTA